MDHSGNCHVPPVQRIPTAEESAMSEESVLQVWGMGCANCAMRVRNSLISQRGVLAAEVDHQKGLALVQHNPDLAPLSSLLTAVEAAGNDGRHNYRAAIA